MGRHKHIWHLARYIEADLIPVGHGAMMFLPAHSYWLCDCGQAKTSDIKEKKESKQLKERT